jgi:hypothetical protein
VEGSVLNASLSSLWLAFVGLFDSLDSILFPCFLSSSFLGCFLFMKFGKVSLFLSMHLSQWNFGASKVIYKVMHLFYELLSNGIIKVVG